MNAPYFSSATTTDLATATIYAAGTLRELAVDTHLITAVAPITLAVATQLAVAIATGACFTAATILHAMPAAQPSSLHLQHMPITQQPLSSHSQLVPISWQLLPSSHFQQVAVSQLLHPSHTCSRLCSGTPSNHHSHHLHLS